MSSWRVVINYKLRENEAKVLGANYCPRISMENLIKALQIAKFNLLQALNHVPLE
jgi:hypothetical protein